MLQNNKYVNKSRQAEHLDICESERETTQETPQLVTQLDANHSEADFLDKQKKWGDVF